MYNLNNFIKETNNKFQYLSIGNISPKEQIEIKSNLKNNYQFFLCQQIPALLLNGTFKHYYKLTDTEMLFIFVIVSNKNTNLNDIKVTDFCFYNEYFKTIVSQDRKINEIIDSLVRKQMIDIFPNIKGGKIKGRYIDFSKIIEKHTKLFNSMIKEKLETVKEKDISQITINSYLRNTRENFNFSNGKIKTSLDTHEKEKIADIISNDDYFDLVENISLIPLFLANREEKQVIESGNKSPLLYFMKNYQKLKEDFFEWLMKIDDSFETEIKENIEDLDIQKKIDSLLDLI